MSELGCGWSKQEGRFTPSSEYDFDSLNYFYALLSHHWLAFSVRSLINRGDHSYGTLKIYQNSNWQHILIIMQSPSFKYYNLWCLTCLSIFLFPQNAVDFLCNINVFPLFILFHKKFTVSNSNLLKQSLTFILKS